MKPILFCIPLLCCVCIYSFKNIQLQQDNSVPLIQIIISESKSTFRWNTMTSYSINVTDKEDGMSKYNEIAANEVLLKVAFLADSLNTKSYLANTTTSLKENFAISLLMKSNCFSCHAFKNKLIGPPFEQVALKYPINSASIEALSKKVIAGSTGTWGNAVMPPHPDIQKENIKEMIRWMLTNSANKNLSYYIGLEGAFRTQENPGKTAAKGLYVLTASYTDHGLKNMPQLIQRGVQTILLHPEPIEKK
jgi:cytochrome c551/c552